MFFPVGFYSPVGPPLGFLIVFTHSRGSNEEINRCVGGIPALQI